MRSRPGHSIISTASRIRILYSDHKYGETVKSLHTEEYPSREVRVYTYREPGTGYISFPAGDPKKSAVAILNESQLRDLANQMVAVADELAGRKETVCHQASDGKAPEIPFKEPPSVRLASLEDSVVDLSARLQAVQDRERERAVNAATRFDTLQSRMKSLEETVDENSERQVATEKTLSEADYRSRCNSSRATNNELDIKYIKKALGATREAIEEMERPF